MPIEFGLLGEVRAHRCGRELGLGSPQQRGVLALLLLAEGRLVSCEELIDRMWGVNPPISARTTVRTYISRLRRSLGDLRSDHSVVESSTGGYRLLASSESVDLTLFEAQSRQARIARSVGDTTQASMLLHAALSLWHGYPLAGVRGEFVEPERVRMEELRLAAVEERIALDLELGKSQELVTELIELVNAHPFRERLSELLMLALYRAGRQADALHAYQRIAALLRRELGIEAGPGLHAQHLKILNSEEGLRCSADCGRGSSKHT